MSDPFLGEIKMFGGNFAPRGYAMCSGQLMAISQNAALFSILGTIYGGDGRVTFGLPDLRGRSPVGWGQGPGLGEVDLGETGGSQNTTLTVQQMPMHSHPLMVSTEAAGADKGTASLVLAQSGDANLGTVNIYGNPTALTNLAAQSCGVAGGNQPFNNLSPYLGLSMIIATEGIFPSRG
ncbi:phage tail protein [Pseudomonas sp. NPDC087612]|uniref:phage tail protein n=1 Tax=unclassified Pseudomonas TaxID=196821 RepID=UPI0005EB5F34|nr:MULTISPECIES: tail fiber protein [unclassified Pseudomonas]KJK18756.1 tail protein [Pseudomonas sp. 2(2015)]QPG62360.1 phage tail protein [Pseudomonas sp. BIGb0427]QVM98896.1 phage tail protein [Pseudomonas sp. SORT22]UVL54235.1 tail fiber protein [Pseudomonas sp. B21-035]UVL59523.1 tail fiber protein [Pseudomonas sp. B21-032]